jgi:hypothetical protein
MGRVRVFIALCSLPILGCLPAATQKLDCAGRDRNHPVCIQADLQLHDKALAGSEVRTYSGRSSANAPPPGRPEPFDGKIDGVVRASRTFISPGQYLPKQFAAWRIVAFPARATPASRHRYILVCREYWSALSAASELSIPLNQQIVTVWPVRTLETAEHLSMPGAEENCEQAVDDYHLATAQTALRHAEIADDKTRAGRGPYLLAWAPPSEEGELDVLVLSFDLSSASAPAHFADSFQRWRREIEMSPDTWQRGWGVAEMRDAIRDWVDHVGTEIATLSANESPQ